MWQRWLSCLLYTSKAFVGCSGIDAVMGMTTENANEVTINQLMVRNVAKDAYIPVSYTHLDVYKRQVQMWKKIWKPDGAIWLPCI